MLFQFSSGLEPHFSSTLFSLLLLLLLLFSFSSSVPYDPSDPSVIRFGQSCALSGLSSRLGTEYSLGLLSAFEYSNSQGGILGSKMIEVEVVDDMYEPEPCVVNTFDFLNDSSIFGLVGYVGTPTSLAVQELVRGDQIPFIGPFTGTEFLRSPFTSQFINIRSSYNDEISTIVNYVIRKRNKVRFSLLFQNDSFGISGKNALIRSLEPYDLPIQSEASYVRNTFVGIDDGQAVSEIAEGEPEAIVMVGSYAQLAKFVGLYWNLTRENPALVRNGLMFFAVSFVGSLPFSEELETTQGLDLQEETEVIVTQVVPYYDDIENFPRVIAEYKAAIAQIQPDADFSFVSFEGYIVGSFLVKALQGIHGNLTRQSLFDSIYRENQKFSVREIEIGPYEDGECNQGLRTVWPTRVLGSANFQVLEDAVFSWEDQATCMSNPMLSKPELRFAQSAAFSGVSGDLGRQMLIGMEAAFSEYDQLQSYDRRLAGILSEDDQYEPTLCVTNTEAFLSDPNTFGLLGYVGTPTSLSVKSAVVASGLPFIAPFTGANGLRENSLTTFINVRAGYDEEIAAQAQHFLKMGLTRFAIFYQDDSFGDGCHVSLETALAAVSLTIVAEATHQRNVVDEVIIRNAAESIRGANPEVILMVGTYAALAKFVELSKQVTTCGGSILCPYYSTVSFVGSLSFQDALGSTDPSNVIISQVVPPFEDTSWEVVRDFHAVVEEELRSFVSFEGYIAGRFVTSVLSSFSDEKIDMLQPADFTQKVYQESVFRVGELLLGPYRKQSCNTGLRQVWLTNLTLTDFAVVDTLSYESCRYDVGSLVRPVLLGQSIDMTQQRYVDYSLGIAYGIEEGIRLANLVSSHDANALLLARSDDGSETLLEENLQYFDEKDIVAFVGLMDEMDSGTGHLTIGTIRPGSPTPDRHDSLHIRPYVYDEVFSVFEYYESQAIAVVVAIGAYTELAYLKKEFIRIEVTSVEAAAIALKDANADVVMCLVEAQQFRSILTQASLANPPILVFTSDHDVVDLTVFPDYLHLRFFDVGSDLYAGFVAEKPGLVYREHAFKGYLLGRLLAENVACPHVSDAHSFLEHFYEESVFPIEDVYIGPFVNGECNVGTRRLYLHTKHGAIVSSFDWSECTRYTGIVWGCYGIPHDNVAVCGGRGRCLDIDTCECEQASSSYGSECSEVIETAQLDTTASRLVIPYRLPMTLVQSIPEESNCREEFSDLSRFGTLTDASCKWEFAFHETKSLVVDLPSDHAIVEGLFLNVIVQSAVTPGQEIARIPVTLSQAPHPSPSKRNTLALAIGLSMGGLIVVICIVVGLVVVIVMILRWKKARGLKRVLMQSGDYKAFMDEYEFDNVEKPSSGDTGDSNEVTIQ